LRGDVQSQSRDLQKQAAVAGRESAIGNHVLGTISLERGDMKEAAERLKRTPEQRFRFRDLLLSLALRNLG
jgi:hypothetical protein